MRVLVVPLAAAVEVVGGHTTQQQETVRALRRHGVEAEIATAQEAVHVAADVVHCFSDVRPLLEHGEPRGRLVLSPIYFRRSFVLGPMTMYRRGERRHMLEVRLRHHARKVRHPMNRLAWLRDQRESHAAWRRADLIIANSNAEAALLRSDVRGLPEIRVAYSGVAEEAFGGNADEGRRLVGIGSERFVLCVARVEPIKNQVSLALALRDLDLPLVLVGSVLPGNERFLEEVRAVMPDVIHVPHVDHELLPHVHAAAAVHILPSWYETTGLSTLEALAVGTPVVVARGPCVEDYFEGIAHFCRPDDVGSIRAALLRALEGPTGAEQEWARRFSWDRTAAELLKAYASLLAS